jgi:hypothetical protein
MAESTHFTTEGTHPKPIRPTPPVEPAPSAEGKESSQNLVDAAMECAIVKDAKPPRFSRIDPASLISMLEEKLGSTVTFKHVAPSAHGSHAQWNFGTQPNDVEVNLVVVDSHKAALGAMRGRLSCISAPVDEVFHQSIPLGQYSLQGTEHVLFIRGNVFVTLTGLPSSAKLGDIAKSVDSFLEKREGDIDTVPVPTLVQKPPPIVPLTIGQEFEIAVKVKDAQWMTTTFQPVVVQLLAVDEARATFRFCALSKGKVDIPLLFTHKDTLRTLTVTVHVEVTGGDDTKGDKGTGKDLGETELDSLYD